ncbi:hypothetical protein Pcinc_019840 [Petrolisthes cinctipes]|uniref:Uncharacterized protein n=1 Tax=Petrolisthes cinctipes TaxID=88211 RepID=A0AAE1FJC2_PETCI|nr:hypothetical protein Pcinc_019840 [Petrolisthes cinctipes]
MGKQMGKVVYWGEEEEAEGRKEERQEEQIETGGSLRGKEIGERDDKIGVGAGRRDRIRLGDTSEGTDEHGHYCSSGDLSWPIPGLTGKGLPPELSHQTGQFDTLVGSAD